MTCEPEEECHVVDPTKLTDPAARTAYNLTLSGRIPAYFRSSSISKTGTYRRFDPVHPGGDRGVCQFMENHPETFETMGPHEYKATELKSDSSVGPVYIVDQESSGELRVFRVEEGEETELVPKTVCSTGVIRLDTWGGSSQPR